MDEMVSGPDLGGGYLHQLTVRSVGSTRIFTYHAQAGGADASGPPLGPLDPFGFSHPPSPCPFGGPRCWHRTFEVEPTAAPAVRLAYNRFRFVATTLLEQQYAGRPAAIETALAEIRERLGEPGSDPERSWYVGGSTAAWLQGARLSPHDIDLGATEFAVTAIAARLQEYLIEPLAHTAWGADRPMRGARAFVGTMREGARTEWGTFQGPAGPSDPFDEWSGDPGRVRTRVVNFHGKPIVVTRPEYALVRALEKGSLDRAGALRECIRSLGVDRELLAALLARSRLNDAARSAERTLLLG